MLEFFIDYGLFLAKTVTLVIAVLVVIVAFVGMSHRNRRADHGHIEVTSLNE